MTPKIRVERFDGYNEIRESSRRRNERSDEMIRETRRLLTASHERLDHSRATLFRVGEMLELRRAKEG